MGNKRIGFFTIACSLFRRMSRYENEFCLSGDLVEELREREKIQGSRNVFFTASPFQIALQAPFAGDHHRAECAGQNQKKKSDLVQGQLRPGPRRANQPTRRGEDDEKRPVGTQQSGQSRRFARAALHPGEGRFRRRFSLVVHGTILV